MPIAGRLITAVALSGLCASLASAQQISARISSRQAEVGEGLTLRVTLVNFPNDAVPETPSTDDFDIRGPNGGESRSVTIFNGRRTEKVEYAYAVEPLREGRLEFPAMTVSVGGRGYSTGPISMTVTKAPPGTFFFCEAQSSAESIYVGQQLDLSLLLWIRQFKQGQTTLNAQQMLNQFDLRKSSLGIFADADFQRVNVSQRRWTDTDGSRHDFYVYTIGLNSKPTKSGPLDFGDIELVYGYPIEIERRRSFSIFDRDRLGVNRIRFVRSRPQMPNIEIKPIPTVDRPSDFNGALGVCEIAVNAKPTTIPVGDPITLTLRIGSKGDLDQLSAPRLDRVEALTRDFEVPTESLAGEVGPGAKTFNLTIRALHEEITEIPPIPMSYFDPDRGTFHTSWSKPIPLTVMPAERLTLSLNPENSMTGRPDTLVETTEGLLANFADPDAVLSDQSGQVGAHVWGLLGAMPVLYLCTWLVQRRVLRLRNDDALRRRQRAHANARRVLHGTNGSVSPADVSTALLGYVADRFNVPSAGITRHDAAQLLGDHAAPDATVRAVDDLLESLEQSQYGGAAQNGGDEWASAARRLVDELERMKLK